MNMEQFSSHNKFIKGFIQLLRDIKPVIVSSLLASATNGFKISTLGAPCNGLIISIQLTTTVDSMCPNV